MLRGILALTIAVGVLFFTGPAQAQEAYRNTHLSPDARAADLVARMTLDEKALQLADVAPAIPRLNVPRYNWWNEGLHGVARADVATVFPQAIGMAATWNAPLLHEAADAISIEFRAKYRETRGPDGGTDRYRGLTVWSPNINIFRDPRWGRGQETYGEDPFLTSQMGIAFIQGLQGDDPNQPRVIATSKHLAVHSGPEANRHHEDVHPSAHDLEDTYLPAFRATVMEGRVQSVMCAYNSLFTTPACANADFLTTRLRHDWRFNGYIVSDCAAVRDFYQRGAHEYVATPEEAVARGFNAGMDLICGQYGAESGGPNPIVTAVHRGLLRESVIDQSLRRLFAARFRLDLMDPPEAGPYATITPAENDTAAHRALARRMAEQSLVLLKNENALLPLHGAPTSIAVVGPNADNLDALVGNYNGTPSHPVTVLAGLRARFPHARITYVSGTGLIGPADGATPDVAFCLDARCRQHALHVAAFATADISGASTPSIAPNASFAWRDVRETSMRWTGWIRSAESGEHRFRFASDAPYRIWIGATLVTDAWTTTNPLASGAITLQAGRAYPIRIEAVQRGRRGDQRLIWSLPSQRDDAAVAAARAADLVVFVGGLSPRIEGEEMRVEAPGFSGGDRTSLDFPAPQEQLLERLQATGKPIVLVLMSGSAIGANWADAHIPAIIQAWYPGGEGGSAVASLIAGDFSPAGRLPVTFYRSVDQLPAFEDYAMAGRTYRYFAGEVLYPFGYGLSFTRFTYANARVRNARVSARGQTVVSVDVTNAGAMSSDEVVQLYLTHPSVAGAPIRALAGFTRVHLERGETRSVQFILRDRTLSIVDPAGVRRNVRGHVDVWIGGGQPGARAGLAPTAGASSAFEITSTATLPH